MSKHTRYDLDTLSWNRFEELCSAILLKQVSPFIVPYLRPGKDGGIDAKLESPPVLASELFNNPISYKVNKEESFWVFQCKHCIDESLTKRQTALKKALKDEIKKWKENETKITHYILLSNVCLQKKAREEIEKMGKQAFLHFECWDQCKISPIVCGDLALQRAFFPTDSTISYLEERYESPTLTLRKTKKTGSKKEKKLPTNQIDISQSIKELVEFEISFSKTNDQLAKDLQYSSDRKEYPEEWVSLEIKAPKNGILQLNTNRSALKTLIEEIHNNNAAIYFWHKFIGEMVQRHEVIIEIRCHPSLKGKFKSLKTGLFQVVPGENQSHEIVDQHLKELESQILTKIKENRISEAKDLQREFSSLRKDYILLKKDYPTSFYPNMRSLGRKPFWGWDFISLWEDIYSHFVDIVFSGQYPSDLKTQLIYIPISICLQSLEEKLPALIFKNNIESLWVIYRELKKSNDPILFQCFTQSFEELLEKQTEIIKRSKDESDINWSKEVSDIAFRFIAELGRISLDDEVGVEFGKLISFLSTLVGVDFRHMSPRECIAETHKIFEGHKTTLQNSLNENRFETLFAWLTFEWFLQRSSGNYNLEKIDLIKQYISIQEIVDQYNQHLNHKMDNHWFEWWFMPKKRRSSWSGRFDHDIREALQLVIVLDSESIDPKILSQVQVFESKHSFDEFLSETITLHKKLSEKYKQRNFASEDNLSSLISEARDHSLERKYDKIRSLQNLSEEKIQTIEEDFSNKIKSDPYENILFQIKEDLDLRKEKPTHFVGPYTLYDKEWFLEDEFVGHSVHGMGEQFAESIIHGREQLAIEKIYDLASQKDTIEDFDKLSKFLKKQKKTKLILLASPLTLDWQTRQKYVTRKRSDSKTQDYFDGVLLILSSHVKENEILITPKNSVIWHTDQKVLLPKIDLIGPNSEIRKSIKEKNPNIDPLLKVIIDVREKGSMKESVISEKVILFQMNHENE